MFTVKKYILLICLGVVSALVAGCENDDGAELKPLDPVAYSINFSVDLTTYFEGNATISGMILNSGDIGFSSAAGQQVARLYEQQPGMAYPGKLVAFQEFTELAPGEYFKIEYTRPWVVCSCEELETLPVYNLRIEYAPDIDRDNNALNDDADLMNNERSRSGRLINDLFGFTCSG